MTDNLAYQEELPSELINGEAVAMSPRPAINHNRIAGNIYRAFANRLYGNLCEAFGDGVDLYLTQQDRFVPDGMIVCSPDIIRHDGVHGAPDLVVEVLSPGTARYDRGHKKSVYESSGVREYWIVEPETKSVEVYLLQNGTFVLNDIYCIYPDYLREKMTEEEKARIKNEVPVSLYDNFTISLKEIFYRT